ncbi:MAG: M28 family peptidase, partial [Planctomycetes bacterium]|nr:M28 family peptidase [Planctomycetota bacterium]
MPLRPAPLLPCLLLLWASCAAPPRLAPAGTFRADVAWLADDARGGRDTGSPGLEEASRWVERQFEAAGLEPAGTEGWRQPFEVAGSRRLIDGNSLALGGAEVALDDQYLPLQTAVSGEAEGPVVFVGYGIRDPEGGWDDYAGVDVKGKVVLALRKGPRVDVEGTRYAANGQGWGRITFAAKVNAAFLQGAAALLVANDPAHYGRDKETDLPQRYGPLGGGRESGATAGSLPAASLSFEAAQGLLAARGVDLTALQQQLETDGQPRSFALDGVTARLVVRSERQAIQSANVLGWLPGNDPALAGEYVVVGAHLDHLGLGEGSPTRGEIHNGADDNASGSAGMVAIARLLAGRRHELKRSVLFAAWSAEELGLLGSEHWVRNPTRPLEGLVAKLNLDMIGRSTDGYVAVEGVGSSPGFSDLVVTAHDALGLELDLHLAPKPSANSDQWPFFREGAPVLAFFTGLHQDYHKPGDDAPKVNAEGGAQIASLAAEIARRLAVADERPAFTQPAGMEERVARDGRRPR